MSPLSCLTCSIPSKKSWWEENDKPSVQIKCYLVLKKMWGFWLVFRKCFTCDLRFRCVPCLNWKQTNKTKKYQKTEQTNNNNNKKNPLMTSLFKKIVITLKCFFYLFKITFVCYLLKKAFALLKFAIYWR